MKKFNFIIAVILLFVLINVSGNASTKGVQILIKGIITDELTGKPVEATVEFRTVDGRKFKNKSNSITGKFEQIFDTGDEVEVIISNWDIARKIVQLKVKDTIYYTEQKVEYTVKKFTPGASIMQLNLFEPSSSALLPEYKNLIENCDLSTPQVLIETNMYAQNVHFFPKIVIFFYLAKNNLIDF